MASDNVRDPKDADKPVRVRRGRVDSVDLYEIKDSELDLLEKGSPGDLQLNFAIFLLSLAFSAICALATAQFSDRRVETVFLLVCVVGILLGGFLLISWYRTRVSLRSICAAIRRRMPPDGLQPPVATTQPAEGSAEKPPDEIEPAG